MKLAMFRSRSGPRPAVQLSDGRYLDLVGAAAADVLQGPAPASVTEIISAGRDRLTPARRLADQVEEGSNGLIERLREADALLDADAVSLLAPLRPQLILCTGAAYKDHMDEMKVPLPKAPAGFIKAAHCLTGPRDPIILPAAAPTMVDFEAEFACVFNRSCHNVTPDQALDYVGGYTMVNDVSARDAVPRWIASLSANDPKNSCDLWSENILFKQYPSFCPLGPVISTKDEIPDPHDVSISATLNGEVMQSAHTSDLIFPLSVVIAHFSRWMRFEAGDVLTTGSPAGVGYARNPQVFMKHGDLIQVWGSRIGALANPVVGASRSI